MDNINPLVSIIVPVYKVEKYINTCVRSLLEQSYNNIEIILIDDGSPDNCPLLCDEFAKQDRRIHVIHKENEGPSSARNIGTQYANGEFITYVDSDDSVSSDYIEYLMYLIDKYDSEISICRIIDCFKENYKDENKSNEYCYTNAQAIEKMLYQTEFTNSASGKLYNKKFKEWLLFPVGKYHEDLMVVYKVLFQAKKICYGQRGLYYYMHHSGSISHSDIFNKKFQDLLDGIYDIEKFVTINIPEILPSVYSRAFSCYSQTLLIIYNNEEHIQLKNQLWSWIVCHRRAIVKDRNTRKKNRIAAMISFLGQRLFLQFYTKLGKKNV